MRTRLSQARFLHNKFCVICILNVTKKLFNIILLFLWVQNYNPDYAPTRHFEKVKI